MSQLEGVLDMIASLSQKVVELERKLDGLGDANERAIKLVADRAEENAKNIVTLSQDIETLMKDVWQLGELSDRNMEDIADLDAIIQTQKKSEDVSDDLVRKIGIALHEALGGSRQ